MFDRKNIKTYYRLGLRKVRNFFLSPKSKEFLTFLFFVFVAFCFWLLQTMNDVYQMEFKIPVRLKNVPKEAVLTSPMPEELKVKVEDRGTVLLNYMLGRTFLPLSFDFTDYQKKGSHIYIPAIEVTKKITAQLNTSTRILSVRPDTLGYVYAMGKAKKVPVKLQGTLHTEPQYYISDMRFRPDSVMVYAPAEGIDTITAAFTRKLNLDNIADTMAYRIGLRPVKGVKFLPASTELLVSVDLFAEKTVEVSVVGVNFPPRKVLRTFPSRVQVTFQVGLKHFKTVSTGDFFIGVSYEELLKAKDGKIPLTVKSSSPFVSKVRVIPAEVDFLIEQQSETETE